MLGAPLLRILRDKSRRRYLLWVAIGSLVAGIMVAEVVHGVRLFLDYTQDLGDWPCIALCGSVDWQTKYEVVAILNAHGIRCAMWDKPRFVHGIHVPASKARKALRLLRDSPNLEGMDLLLVHETDIGKPAATYRSRDGTFERKVSPVDKGAAPDGSQERMEEAEAQSLFLKGEQAFLAGRGNEALSCLRSAASRAGTFHAWRASNLLRRYASLFDSLPRKP